MGGNQGLECLTIRVHGGRGLKGLSTVQYASEVVRVGTHVVYKLLIPPSYSFLLGTAVSAARTQLRVDSYIEKQIFHLSLSSWCAHKITEGEEMVVGGLVIQSSANRKGGRRWVERNQLSQHFSSKTF